MPGIKSMCEIMIFPDVLGNGPEKKYMIHWDSYLLHIVHTVQFYQQGYFDFFTCDDL